MFIIQVYNRKDQHPMTTLDTVEKAKLITSDDAIEWSIQTKSEDRISWIKLGDTYYGRKLEEAPE